MIQASLFAPPESTREERRAELDALPPPANSWRIIPKSFIGPAPRLIPSARIDPIGHLSACADPDCGACATLRLDFGQCPCGRWAARAVLYGGRCFGCHNAARGAFDGREDRYFWRAPAGLA